MTDHDELKIPEGDPLLEALETSKAKDVPSGGVVRSAHIEGLAQLFEMAELVVLITGDTKAGLGRDMQRLIIDALRDFAKTHPEWVP